jgi:hypothetical protein
MIAFVQPFGLYAPGGGSRILRALLEGKHPPTLSIYTGGNATEPSRGIEEIHLATRPGMGRLDRTRFHKSLGVLDGVFRSRFEGRLRQTIRERKIEAIHIVPHSYDIVPVYRVATKLKIPYFLNIHDELEFVATGHPLLKEMVAVLGEAWRKAAGVFVISDEMGKEYSARYGKRDYEVITDGLATTAAGPLARPAKSLRVYFMGLFHYRYQANFRALLDALKLIRAEHPDWDVSATCRCGSIFGKVEEDDVPVTILPFAPESEVTKDMLSADLLYQPLPFEADAVNFGKFSLSTKLVTYLGSGLPILYHGPEDTAACQLLMKHDAAVTCTTLDPVVIARQLTESMSRREVIVKNALKIARERFMLADQQKRFWGPIEAVLPVPISR